MAPILKRTIETHIRQWACSTADRPLLVRGARRVGKTFTVERVGKELFGENFVKLDFQTDLDLIASLFDGPTDDVDRIVGNIADYKHRDLQKESAMLLFDEVQLCEKALNSLRFFSGSGWRVSATGSQLGVDTRQRHLPFPSGIDQVVMHPMTFGEFLMALGKDRMAEEVRAHTESLQPYVAHGEALSLFRLYQVIGGMPRAVLAYLEAGAFDEVRVQQREIDETYTADMADPSNGISGVAARKVWGSISAQLLRSSTKKFKYSEVERGGRRAKLMEPLDWIAGAGMASINYLTECLCAPLVPVGDDEGSYFKVYLADTGLMFYKLHVNPELWIKALDEGTLPVSSDFRGALAENAVMQAFAGNDLLTRYWVPPKEWHTQGELDFLLQDEWCRPIPVEVKSARNVRAKTLAAFMEKSEAPYAVVLSENNFSASTDKQGRQIRYVPLYAAFCLEEGLAKAR